MFKKIISLFLIAILLVAFSVPALAHSDLESDVTSITEEVEIAPLSVRWVSVVREFRPTQTIPGSIQHVAHFGIRTYGGTLPRTRVANISNPSGHLAWFEGNLSFFWV